MFASKISIAGFIAFASATSLHPSDDVFTALLKRQAPGTPSYNCHDNCGTYQPIQFFNLIKQDFQAPLSPCRDSPTNARSKLSRQITTIA
jgi:hypothetical protein